MSLVERRKLLKYCYFLCDFSLMLELQLHCIIKKSLWRGLCIGLLEVCRKKGKNS